jgi:hypothetical protein
MNKKRAAEAITRRTRAAPRPKDVVLKSDSRRREKGEHLHKTTTMQILSN